MGISRRRFFRSVGALATAGALGPGCRSLGQVAAAGPSPDRPPNILCIVADDMDRRYLGCYGGDFLTPHIDSLAADGLRFEEAYCVSPACVPTRYAMLTGTYPGRCTHPMFTDSQPLGRPYRLAWNTPITADTPTTARVLREAGYFTGFAGKWHNWWDPAIDTARWPKLGRNDDPDDAGVDRKLREYQRCLVDGVKRTGGFEQAASVVNGNYAGVPKALVHHHFEWLAQGALDLLDRAAAAGRPFYLQVATTGVHGPDHAQNLSRDPRYTYAGKLPEPPDCVPPRAGIRDRLERAGLPADSDHVGMVQNDDLVGALLGRLRDLGLERDTVVLFLPDHGVEPGKATCYQKGVHVATLMRWPGRVPQGGVCRERVQFVDLLPTFADLAGADLPAGGRLDGVSFLPAALGRGGLGREVLYFEMGMSHAVLKGDYKYVAFRYGEEEVARMRGGEIDVALDNMGSTNQLHSTIAIRYFPDYFDQDQLYNVSGDPWEQRNLAADPAHAEVLRDMRAELVGVLGTFRHPFSLAPCEYMDSPEFRSLAAKRTELAKAKRWWHDDFRWPDGA